MIKVLIPTKPDDPDAIYVKFALEKKGHECVIWYTADYPQQQTHSFELFEKNIRWNVRGVDLHMDNPHFDVVWLRRPRKPALPDIIHQDDIENAKNENMTFFKSLWRVIAPDAFWVNPIDKVNAANCKLLQLKIAMETGFNVPDTLFSNDPQRIRQFINGYYNKDVIYKTLYPVIWMGGDEVRLTYTNEIRIEDLPSDYLLQSTPGIYQHKISKDYELRVTYFGNHVSAVKIKSQEHSRGKLDWRYIPTHELVIEPYTLPEEIDTKCRLLLKKMGLVMGCFDFIVTPDQEYYFLEINEQGQFFWIEELCPEINLLDAFTDFLISGTEDFNYRKQQHPILLRDFKTRVISLRENAISRHIKPEIF